MLRVDHTPPDRFDGATWYVIVCNVKCERRAQLGLRRKGYRTYLPFERRQKTHARKVYETENPLLPRYLFVGLRQNQDFYHLRGVDGVESIVRFDGTPVVVPTAGLERIRDRERAGEFDHVRKAEEEKARKEAMKPGTCVYLKRHDLSGMQAVVEQVRSSGQIMVLIDFLGGKTRATVRLQDIELSAAE